MGGSTVTAPNIEAMARAGRGVDREQAGVLLGDVLNDCPGLERG